MDPAKWMRHALHAIRGDRSSDGRLNNSRRREKDLEHKLSPVLRSQSQPSASAKSRRRFISVKRIFLDAVRPFSSRRRRTIIGLIAFLLLFLFYYSGDAEIQEVTAKDDDSTMLFSQSFDDDAGLRSSRKSNKRQKVRGRVGRLMEQLTGAEWAAAHWKGQQDGGKADSNDMDDVFIGAEDVLWKLPTEAGDGLPDLADLLAPPKKERQQIKNSPKTPLKAGPIPQFPRKDGRLLLLEGQEHPIPKLMHRAKRRWAALKSKQSKTFKQAVAEYQRRYGRAPPRGFDRWYAFARAHNVRLIDEFDLIERDLHPYRAFSPESFRARVAALGNAEKFDFLWGFKIIGGSFERMGQLAHHQRAKDVESLCKRFLHELPDMTMWYNGHDTARIMIPWEEVNRLNELVAQDLYDDLENDADDFGALMSGPAPGWGIPQLCAPSSVVRSPNFNYGEATRSMTGREMPPLPKDDGGKTVTGTMIDSFKRYIDVCDSPQYRHFHSSTSWVYPHWPTGLLPLFTPGVHSNFNDIHSLIVEQFDLEAVNDPAWEERPFDKLVWRGQTSGPQWDEYSPWITSHRSRLHLLSHEQEGVREISLAINEKPDPLLSQSQQAAPRANIVKKVAVPNKKVNDAFLDTGMVGPPVQCFESTCEEMKKLYKNFDERLSFDRSNLYKYVLDVDGNSWSGRFRRLMLSNAAVIKATVYTEFWTDWAIPWLHFIPMQVDYSDMWDIMAFFRGGVDGEGEHDNLAKEIALAGKDWAEKHFRWADLEAYQFRLMLEYGRLWAEDRSTMDFVEDEEETEEPVWEQPGTFQKRLKRRVPPGSDE